MTLEAPAPFDPGAALLSRAEATRAEAMRQPSVQAPSVLDLQRAMGTAGTVEEARRTLRGEGGVHTTVEPLVPWLPTPSTTEVGPPMGPYECISAIDISCGNVVRPVVQLHELLPYSVGGRGPWWVGNIAVTIVPGAEVCQSAVDMVLAALRLLERFTEPGDIIDWMVCLLDEAKCGIPLSNCIPPESLPDLFDLYNLVGYFHGSLGSEARVSLSPGSDDPEAQLPIQLPGMDWPAPGEIRLGVANERFTNVLYAWQHGTEVERTCAVLRLSAILLHEFLHLLSLPGGSLVHPEPSHGFWATTEECNPWNVIPNLYLYAARRRLGWEWSRDGSACCAEPSGPNRMFMSNSISYWQFVLPTKFPQRGYEGSDGMRKCVDGLPILGGIGVDILCPSGIYLDAPGFEQLNPGLELRSTSVEAGRMP